MKAIIVLFGLLLSGIILLYSLKLKQSTVGPHGGEVKQAENFNIEMKAAFPNLYFYLLDQKLKPIENKGISCEVRFFFPGDTSTDLTIKPFQEDGFILEASKIVYNSCRVTFNVFGKSISAKFEKESIIVQEKLNGN